MLKNFVVVAVVALIGSASYAQAPDPNEIFVLKPSLWTVYTPDWGSVQPRLNEEVRQFCLQGGSWVVSNRDYDRGAVVKLGWFPEIYDKDALSILVYSTGEASVDCSSFVPKDGILLTIGEGKLIVRIRYPESKKSVVEEIQDERLNIAPTDLMWTEIALKPSGSGAESYLDIHVGDDTMPIHRVRFHADRFPGRRIGFGNKPVFMQNDERRIPTSFIEGLRFE